MRNIMLAVATGATLVALTYFTVMQPSADVSHAAEEARWMEDGPGFADGQIAQGPARVGRRAGELQGGQETAQWRQGGRRAWRRGAGMRGLQGPLSGETLAKTAAEERILSVLDEMDASRGMRFASVSRADGRLLRVLTEAIGAKHVVEIGTSQGYSALWFCMALKGTGGKLVTHEIDEERAKLARGNFARAGVADIATVVEGDAHETVKRLTEPIDVLFLDADKQGYMDYLDTLLPLVRAGGLIVAHNMNRPAPDPDYIEAITGNSDLETVFVHMNGSGIGVSLKKR